MSLEAFGRFLSLAGVFIVIFGLLLMLWNKIPLLGKLPGDIVWQKGNFQLFFPVATSLLISSALTIMANLIIRLIVE